MNEADEETQMKNEFRLVCEITNSENPIDDQQVKFLRKLNEDDLEYFKDEFCHVCMWFVKSVSAGLSGKLT